MSVDFIAAVVGKDNVIRPAQGLAFSDSVNVANGAAAMLLGLIGIDTDELCGVLSITQLREICELVDDYSLTSQMTVTKGSGGCTIIDMGYSIDRLRGYSLRFSDLADLAEKVEAEFISYC